MNDPKVDDIRGAQKLIRRAKFYKDVGLTFRPVHCNWGKLVLIAFSDAGWATRPSGHSQAGVMLMLSDPSAAEGKTALANVIDYQSAKITLTVQSSYDAELHACSDAVEIGENTQATMAELKEYTPGKKWSISAWLSGSHRCHVYVVIDAKGLWTKIQSEWKTEKRGTIYIRRLMEILTRTGAKVYWVNSGHMLSDGLTKCRQSPLLPTSIYCFTCFKQVKFE